MREAQMGNRAGKSRHRIRCALILNLHFPFFFRLHGKTDPPENSLLILHLFSSSFEMEKEKTLADKMRILLMQSWRQEEARGCINVWWCTGSKRGCRHTNDQNYWLMHFSSHIVSVVRMFSFSGENEWVREKGAKRVTGWFGIVVRCSQSHLSFSHTVYTVSLPGGLWCVYCLLSYPQKVGSNDLRIENWQQLCDNWINEIKTCLSLCFLNCSI